MQPGSSVIVSVVLLERARLELENAFGEVGPIAEFRQTDKIVVEWCRAPEAVYRRLMGDDSEKDFEILSTFWNTKGYEFSTPVVTARQPMLVRFSMSAPPSSAIDKQVISNSGMVLPAVSLDESTDHQPDPSITCDDSLMLSMSTWDEDSAVRFHEDRGGIFPKRPSHISSHKSITNQARALVPASPHPMTPDAASSSKSTIHKFQLQQTLRCGGCYEVFSRDPEQLTIPVMSQACGHTICRGCVVRKADEHFSFTQTYQNTVSCPLCNVPHAFSLELHINHSLCAVIALIDT